MLVHKDQLEKLDHLEQRYGLTDMHAAQLIHPSLQLSFSLSSFLSTLSLSLVNFSFRLILPLRPPPLTYSLSFHPSLCLLSLHQICLHQHRVLLDLKEFLDQLDQLDDL